MLPFSKWRNWHPQATFTNELENQEPKLVLLPWTPFLFHLWPQLSFSTSQCWTLPPTQARFHLQILWPAEHVDSHLLGGKTEASERLRDLVRAMAAVANLGLETGGSSWTHINSILIYRSQHVALSSHCRKDLLIKVGCGKISSTALPSG